MSVWVERPLSKFRPLSVLFVLAVAAWMLATATPLEDDEIARAVVILAVLITVSIGLFSIAAREEQGECPLFWVLLLSFGLKLLAMSFRFSVGLLADAILYDRYGAGIAQVIQQGGWPEFTRMWGTEFIRLLVGIVYFVTGRTFYGISILWAWFGLLGILFFYKAFKTAFPTANRRHYMLIFFYPSMLLWTSSLGKDALVVFCLGMATLGAARALRQIDFMGLLWLGLGMSGLLMIRPHIAAVFAVALGVGFLLRPIRAGKMTAVIRVVGAVFFIAVSVFVLRTASGFIGVDVLSTEEVFGFIDITRERTTTGGSAFQQVNPRSPAALLAGIPTVLFRPFPWEAHRTYALFSALEGTAILVLTLVRWRSLRAAIADSRRNGFLMLIVVYVLLFTFFFSAIGNFGIIARQRVQLLPFLFMLLFYKRSPER